MWLLRVKCRSRYWWIRTWWSYHRRRSSWTFTTTRIWRLQCMMRSFSRTNPRRLKLVVLVVLHQREDVLSKCSRNNNRKCSKNNNNRRRWNRNWSISWTRSSWNAVRQCRLRWGRNKKKKRKSYCNSKIVLIGIVVLVRDNSSTANCWTRRSRLCSNVRAVTNLKETINSSSCSNRRNISCRIWKKARTNKKKRKIKVRHWTFSLRRNNCTYQAIIIIKRKSRIKTTKTIIRADWLNAAMRTTKMIKPWLTYTFRSLIRRKTMNRPMKKERAKTRRNYQGRNNYNMAWWHYF